MRARPAGSTASNTAAPFTATCAPLLSNRPKVQDHLGIKMAGSSNFYAKITEEGPPLRNILLKRLLPALSDEETRALSDEPTADATPQPVSEAILALSGGHPFLTQYLMY